jgi:hypothetical protein
MGNRANKNYVQLGYGATYQVDTKDISPLLAILDRSVKVDRRYVGDDSVWVIESDRYGRITINQDANEVITHDEYESRKAAHDEARERANAERADT